MNKKIKKDDNFLELVPKKNKKYEYEINNEGLVQILILRDSFLEKAVRMFFNTPKVMKIDLDPYGSFVWNTIDDTKNIEEIGHALQKEFGEKIDPLYERLGTYINILKNNKFVTIEKVCE